jgi:hypothetical protein
MWFPVLLAKKSWMLASTIATFFLLTIILTSFYSLRNLQMASALSASSNSTSTSLKLNQTSINATKNSTLFLNYDNPILGIKMQYPSHWLVALHFIRGVFITQFVSPNVNSTDGFANNINIAIQKIVHVTTLQQYVKAVASILSARHFNIILSKSSNNSTIALAGMPAFENVFIVKQHALEKDLKVVPVDLKIMQLYTLKADRAYIITYTAEPSKFSSDLPIVQKMIDSLKITTPINNLIVSSASTSNNQTLGPSFRSQANNNTAAPTATFHATFDTYIQPGSAKGFGVYSERPNDNNSFITGETAELYVVPSGFAYKPIISNQSEKTSLYQSNFTANVLVFDKQGKQVLATQYKVPKIALNQKVPELYVTIPLSIPQNFPTGEYKVRYFIIDGTSGKNFEIDKNVNIIAPKLQISASS